MSMCLNSRSNTQFGYRHLLDNICIPHEGNYPRCNLCDMQASTGTINSELNRNSKTCKEGHRRKLQRKAYRCSTLSLNEKFTVYGQELERVELLKYLGRILMCDDNDIQDVRSNLNKACTFWRQISNVLRSKNMSPKVCGMFYKATI